MIFLLESFPGSVGNRPIGSSYSGIGQSGFLHSRGFLRHSEFHPEWQEGEFPQNYFNDYVF